MRGCLTDNRQPTTDESAVVTGLNAPFSDERGEQYLRLLGQHEGRLLGFILSLVPNWADAEDIAQEVKIRLWKQFDGYDPTKDFGAWARTIARYMVLAFRERQSRQNRLVSSRFVELVAEEAAAISEDLDAEQQALKDCFEKLPEAKRELLYLRYYPGRQTVQEIAAKLGRTYEATRKAILRARMALADCIEETLHREDRP